VFVDFDGTIVPADVTDTLFGRFALPEWLDIEADWKAGRIGSRECMARQVDLMRCTPAEYDALCGTVDVDPHFPTFVELCRSAGIGMTVVSDGLDRSIRNVLGRAGLDLPYFANRLEHQGGDRWRLGFPHARSACAMLSGNCKCQFAEAHPGSVHLMIGDGRSDFCIAGRVDFTLAKGALAVHCREKGLPHRPVTDFSDVVEIIQAWVANDTASDWFNLVPVSAAK
jgi:2,3-diketo-5-methylthio-1-phosphopentane phosphatase